MTTALNGPKAKHTRRIRGLFFLSFIGWLWLCCSVRVHAQSWLTSVGSENERLLLRQISLSGSLPASFSAEIRPWYTDHVASWLERLPNDPTNKIATYNHHWLLNQNAPGSRKEKPNLKKRKLRIGSSNPARIAESSHDRVYGAVNAGLDLSYAMSRNEDLPLFINHRMVEFYGSIGSKVGFYSRVDETQLRPAEHEYEFFAKWRVLPGAHLIKGYRTRGFDYLTAKGYVTYALIPEIRIQFGQDQNFIGNGIRSLLLSDFAPSYPFLKIHTRVGRFDYVNLYARLTDRYSRITNPGQYTLLPSKYLAMHYLAITVSPKWRAGIFEAVMFHDNNNTGKGFDISYLNPIVLYRAIEHQRGDPDKITVGFNTQYIARAGVEFYGQILLNEFRINDLIKRNGSYANKYGYQVGMRLASDQVLTGFELQTEYNRIRPYSYAHYTISGTYPVNSYSHQNQPLAHPMGANLSEWLLQASFQPWPRIKTGMFGQYVFYGADSAGSNWGNNIFLDYRTFERETGNVVGQGVATHLINLNGWLGYELRHALCISLEARVRRLRSTMPIRNRTDAYAGISLRYNLTRQKWHY